MPDDDFHSPTPDQLRIMHQSIPGLLRERAKVQNKHAQKNGKTPAGRPCNICGEIIKIISKNPSGYCLSCEKKLDEGQTAIVSMDGRYMFIRVKQEDIEREKDMFVAITGNLPKKWPKDFTIKKCVLPTPTERMDTLVKLF